MHRCQNCEQCVKKTDSTAAETERTEKPETKNENHGCEYDVEGEKTRGV